MASIKKSKTSVAEKSQNQFFKAGTSLNSVFFTKVNDYKKSRGNISDLS
jgi:hypothetical protein